MSEDAVIEKIRINDSAEWSVIVGPKEGTLLIHMRFKTTDGESLHCVAVSKDVVQKLVTSLSAFSE